MSWISLELSNTCRRHCLACRQDVARDRDNFMPAHKAEDLLNQLYQLADTADPLEKGFKLKLFWMGESLLNPDFIRIIDYVKKYHRAFSMVALDTGGSEMLDKEASALVELAHFTPLYLNFTLDAVHSETYKLLKGGDLAQAEAGLFRILKMREQARIFPLVSVQFIVQEENYRETRDFIRRWQKVFGHNAPIITDGYKLFGFNDCIFIKRNENDAPDSVNSRNYAALCNELCLDYDIPVFGDIQPRFPGRTRLSNLMIRFDGRSTPFCDDFSCQHSGGNAFQIPLKTLLYPEQLQAESLRPNHPCVEITSAGDGEAGSASAAEAARGYPETSQSETISAKASPGVSTTISAKAGSGPLFLPPSLGIVISEQCPLNCIMCIQKTLEKPGHFMPLQLWKDILDEIADIPFWRPTLVLNCFESFMHPDIAEMLEYALQKPEGWSRIVIDTNAQLMYPHISQRLVAALQRLELSRPRHQMQPVELNISLDAIKAETYSKIRRNGSLRQAEENIMVLLKYRKNAGLHKRHAADSEYSAQGTGFPNPGLRIQFLALQENVGEAEKFTRKWLHILNEYGCRPALGSNHNLPPVDSVMIKQVVLNRRYSVCGSAFRDICNNLGLPYNSSFISDSAKQSARKLPCGWLFSSITIKSDGSVIPCQPGWNRPVAHCRPVTHCPDTPEAGGITVRQLTESPDLRELRCQHACGMRPDYCRDCNDATLTDGEHIHALKPALDCLAESDRIEEAAELAERASEYLEDHGEMLVHLLSRIAGKTQKPHANTSASDAAHSADTSASADTAGHHADTSTDTAAHSADASASADTAASDYASISERLCRMRLKMAPGDLMTRRRLVYLLKDRDQSAEASRQASRQTSRQASRQAPWQALEILDTMPTGSLSHSLQQTRAWLLLLAGRSGSQAREYLEAAVKQARECVKNDSSPESSFILSMCLLESGLIDEAAELLHRIKDSDSESSAQARQMLRSIDR